MIDPFAAHREKGELIEYLFSELKELRFYLIHESSILFFRVFYIM
jgi:hypothetical protein